MVETNYSSLGNTFFEREKGNIHSQTKQTKTQSSEHLLAVPGGPPGGRVARMARTVKLRRTKVRARWRWAGDASSRRIGTTAASGPAAVARSGGLRFDEEAPAFQRDWVEAHREKKRPE